MDTSRAPSPAAHLVTFYEDDEFLVRSVLEFLAPALAGGGTAVAVAEPAHLAAIEEGLAARGLHGLVAIEAEHLLSKITKDGCIDPAAFDRELGELLEAAHGRTPRIFGEMVAVLWARGDLTGALELEDCWNEAGPQHDFELLCGYPLTAFEHEEQAEAFHEVCVRHSSVIPTESYSELSDPEQQRRVVAQLQQEAAAGTHERRILQAKEAELQEALDRFRELDNLRNEFTAMVVHDIKSPAAIAAGFLELVLEDWGALDGDETRKFVRHALGNLRRIQRLVGDVLTMAQIDSGEFSFDLRPLDLGRLVEETIEELRGTTGRAIRVDVEAGLRPALVDGDRQIQILTNLVSNAVKFSSDDTRVEVTVADDGDDLRVTVADHGVGIPDSERDTLFRPFARARTESLNGDHGTGLGLYIAKALVEGQGGSLRLESREGVGTTVEYTVLPAT